MATKNNNKNATNAKDAKTTILRDHSLAGIFISSIRYSLCIQKCTFKFLADFVGGLFLVFAVTVKDFLFHSPHIYYDFCLMPIYAFIFFFQSRTFILQNN